MFDCLSNSGDVVRTSMYTTFGQRTGYVLDWIQKVSAWDERIRP